MVAQQNLSDDVDKIEAENDQFSAMLLDGNLNAMTKMRRLLERESETYIDLSERSEEISEAIERTPSISQHLPEEWFFGSHILASLFAGFGFFRATKAFLEGEKEVFVPGAKLAYSVVVLTLVILGLFLTGAAPAFGLVTAALGLLMSTSYLINYFKNTRAYALLESQYQQEMDQLDQQAKTDLQQLDALNTEDDDFDQKMESLYRSHLDRQERYAALADLQKQNSLLKDKLNRVALSRAYSIFTASIGLAGAIVLVASTSLAGPILLFITFGLGVLATVYGGGRLVQRYLNLQNTPLKEDGMISTDQETGVTDQLHPSKDLREEPEPEVTTNASLEKLSELRVEDDSPVIELAPIVEEDIKEKAQVQVEVEDEEREGESTKP